MVVGQTGKTLLIVDDHVDLLELLTEQVRTLGYETVSARHGFEALPMIENQRIDGVLCDINMPEMNGIELLTRLRTQRWAMPFVFVTAEITTRIFWEAVTLGARDFLRKPFERQSLQEAIDSMLGQGPRSHTFKTIVLRIKAEMPDKTAELDRLMSLDDASQGQRN